MPNIDLQIMDEDDLANVFGRFASATFFTSECRQFWMLSWPHRAILLLSKKPHLVQLTLTILESDYKLFLKLKAKEGRLPHEELVCSCSVIQLTPMMQIIHGLVQNKWKVSCLVSG